MVVLQHLDIRVVGETVLADGGEIGRLPAGAVQVLLDLRRHSGNVQRLQLCNGFLSCRAMLEGREESGALEISLTSPIFCNQLYR